MSDDWRLVDQSPDVALTLAIQWAIAVRAQARRVTDGTGTDEQIPDAYLLVIALRNVRRAAKLAVQTFDTQAARDQLTEALKEFDNKIPGATDARDVLEHFDDYTRGIGNLQRRGATTEDPEELARAYLIDFRFRGGSASSKRPILTVGPYTIDLHDASHAASRLVHEIGAAGNTDQGDPVSRAELRGFLDGP